MVVIKSVLICYQHNFSFVITDLRKIKFLILTVVAIYILVTVLSENDPTKDSPFTSLATLKRGSSFGVSIQCSLLFIHNKRNEYCLRPNCLRPAVSLREWLLNNTINRHGAVTIVTWCYSYTGPVEFLEKIPLL